MSVEEIKGMIGFLGILIFLLIARQIRDLIVSLIADFRWLLTNLILRPMKQVGRGISFVFLYPSRVNKRRRLRESPFNVIPSGEE